MNFLDVYPYVVVGIVISFILPILRQAIPKTTRALGARGFLQTIWPIAKPYIIILIFSLFSAILIVAYIGDTLTDWRAALLAGFSWDSLMQKIGHS